SGPRVHLASLRLADDAVATWRALQGRHPDVLAGLGLALARLDLGEGVGVFYQVQAGPFADAAAARAACDVLHGRGQFCQPVAP
ncbi:MAG: SPOR domain-containing protein, partial [Alphaproteobacteria bacterium]